MISTVQARTNGALLIENGTNPASGVTRRRTYERGIVAHELQLLTNVIDGFDFSLNPIVNATTNRVTGVTFDTHYPFKGVTRNGLPPLKVGPGGNVKTLGGKTKTKLYNSGISEGSGTGDVISSELNFGSLQKAYTRREIFKAEKNISVPETLSNKLNAFLTIEGVERFVVDIGFYPDSQPMVGDYDIGDTFNFDLEVADSGGYVDIEGEGRLIAESISVDAQGAETRKPKFDVIV